MKKLTKIFQAAPIHPDLPGNKGFDKKKPAKKKLGQTVTDHFEELVQLVDDTHKELEDMDSPFRLCVYQDGDDMYIDVITIDDTGTPCLIHRHDISQEQVEDIVRHIKSGTGLLLDADA